MSKKLLKSQRSSRYQAEEKRAKNKKSFSRKNNPPSDLHRRFVNQLHVFPFKSRFSLRFAAPHGTVGLSSSSTSCRSLEGCKLSRWKNSSLGRTLMGFRIDFCSPFVVCSIDFRLCAWRSRRGGKNEFQIDFWHLGSWIVCKKYQLRSLA